MSMTRGSTLLHALARSCIGVQDLRMCHVCQKVARSMNCCGACKQVPFCSKACQKAGWKEHKPECQLIVSLLNQTQALDRTSQHVLMMKIFRTVLRVRA